MCMQKCNRVNVSRFLSFQECVRNMYIHIICSSGCSIYNVILIELFANENPIFLFCFSYIFLFKKNSILKLENFAISQKKFVSDSQITYYA